MSDIVIKTENIGKKYIIGHQAERGGYTALRDVLMQNARTLWNKTKDLVQGQPIIQGDTMEEVWALKDVSFELRRGEAVGIIGRNGAGKSTLLKILSRITEPSTGRITIKGRVASLLEVGTGFHPELTGRENIYLNGTILGMSRKEIKRKFDEIVAFAEVEKYLDTPVKRYSTGMYVRLAFAVAAHLEPEILVIDEVLAVGDASFQKKCLGKMDDISKQGRTVLFVSHNMTAVHNLCPVTIWLDSGRIREIGATPWVIQSYLSLGEHTRVAAMELKDWPNRYGSNEARIISARLLDENSNLTTVFHRTRPMIVEYVIESHCRHSLHFSATIIADSGIRVLHLSHHDTKDLVVGVLNGSYLIRFEIPMLPLCAGNYNLVLAVHTDSLVPVDVVTDVLRFTAEDVLDSPRPYKTIATYAYSWTPNNWSVTPIIK